MRSIVVPVLCLAAATPIVHAQGGTEPVTLGNEVVLSGSLRTRVESWSWFSGDANGDYVYSGSLARFAVSRSTPKREWQIEFAVPILFGLPDNAIAPGAQGQAGLGATYFASNGDTNAAMLFVKQASVRFKGIGGRAGNSLRIGRIEFTEGTEVTPRNASLAAIKRDRIAQRLVGNFGFTHVGRSFDGVQWVGSGDTFNVTAFGGRPTKGVFQVDGWGELKVNVFYGALTAQHSDATEWRVFAIGYNDYRDGVLKTDSRSLSIRRADTAGIDIVTTGGHYLHLAQTTAGPVDVLLWGAVQAGSWGELSHHAGAFAVELGWQPQMSRLAPWIRGGYDYGSGDGDPDDGTHGTFFQILPTPRVYARFPFYGMMNSGDAFGELVLRPIGALNVRMDVHALRLARNEDLWYLGGGAFQPGTFGFTGRPSNAHAEVATLYDVSADLAVNRYIAVTGYYSYAAGRNVVRAIYPRGANGRLGYLELLVRF